MSVPSDKIWKEYRRQWYCGVHGGIRSEKGKNKNSLTGGFEPPTFRLTAERSAD
jgi:hypothetical protein